MVIDPTDIKWYSNGLTTEQAEKLEKRYAKIEEPIFGLMKDENYLALQFGLRYENGSHTYTNLSNPKDIKNLFVRTHTCETSELEGKVIEAFIDESLLSGLSVNENLV